MYHVNEIFFSSAPFILLMPLNIFTFNINKYVDLKYIHGILMMYSMFRFGNSELGYYCFSKTTSYHVIIPVV